MQHIAWLKLYEIQMRRCLKDFFSLNLINAILYPSLNVQETLVIQLFELKNYCLLPCFNLQ